jgi:hypothetical protein
MYESKTSYVAYGKNLYAPRFTKLPSGIPLHRATCIREFPSHGWTKQFDPSEHFEVFKCIEHPEDTVGRHSLSTGKLIFSLFHAKNAN